MVQQLNGVRFGKPVRYNRPGYTIMGDTWSTAWSKDGQLFTVIDDTPGFEMAFEASGNRNMAIGTFGDSTPPNLTGNIINGMEAYGRGGQLGADGACWKGNGITSVDGVLVLSISRHWYHVRDYDHRQISRHCSLVKSEDGGKTWLPNPHLAEPLPDPLFPGPRFAICFFVDYGQDGALPEPIPHQADTYIYAISNDGYWNNGNAIHLARVARDKLTALKLGDWEFYCGYRSRENQPIWRSGKPGLEACYPILSKPFGFGQTGMNFLPAFQCYVLIGWHYPRLSLENWNHQECTWDFYQSPTPWGPWRQFFTHTWETEGFYNPILPGKFFDPQAGSAWVLTCGDFNTWNKPAEETLYTLHTIPIEWICV
jgi:hypothetical protein